MAEATLLDALEEDTRNQCAAVLREAEETAERIGKEAVEAAEAAFDARLKEARASFERKRAAAINSARTKMNGLTLGVRHRFIEDVFTKALKGISDLPKEEYSKLLNRLYAEMKEDWQKAGIEEKPIVLINPNDAGIIKDHAEFKPDQTVSLGVVFVSPDDKLRFENTVSSRLSRIKADMIPVINKALFG